IGKSESLRIHDRERFDMIEFVLTDALVGLAQHRLGIIYADDPVGTGIIHEGYAGANADIENKAADALGRGNRGLASGIEHGAKYQVVDRRPPRVGLGHRSDVDSVPHCPRPLSRTHASDATRASRARGAGNDATALWMMPPPSTRARPSAAS